MIAAPTPPVFLDEDGNEIPLALLSSEQVSQVIAVMRPWLDSALRTLEAEPNLPGAELEQVMSVNEHLRQLIIRLIVLAAFDTPRGRA